MVISITSNSALERLQNLLAQIPELKEWTPQAPPLAVWRQNVEGVLSQYYGEASLQLAQFKTISHPPRKVAVLGVLSLLSQTDMFNENRIERLEAAEGFIRSRIIELEEEVQIHTMKQAHSALAPTLAKDLRKVFVVHGHDHGSKETVARYLTKIGLLPVILHEQADEGRTIIEKLEHHSDVACAVVILSADDIGTLKSKPSAQEGRARQNVIFEMGFFVGRLGRKHTFALVQKGVTRPSDIDGVLYISMDEDLGWRLKLVGELKAAGMDVDANKAFA